MKEIGEQTDTLSLAHIQTIRNIFETDNREVCGKHVMTNNEITKTNNMR